MESASIQHDSVASAIAASWPPTEWTDFGVILAVSGGADSVAMACAMQRLREETGGRGEIVVAHFHHGLRQDADGDTEWLARFCGKQCMELIVGRGDVRQIADAQRDGVEAAARSARHKFLAEAAAERGARFVVTGHTADDQVETVLFRILRGTGLHGLAGMRRSRPLSPGVTLIRPMLGATRADVIDYLNSIGQDWREDATNADSHFTRNKIRNDLLPRIRRELNPCADEALLRLAGQAASASAILSEIAAPLTQKNVQFEFAADSSTAKSSGGRRADATCLRITVAQLLGQNDSIIAELVRTAWRRAGWPEQAMTEAHWQWLVALVRGRANPTRRTLPSGIDVERDGNMVVARRHCAPSSPII